MSVAHEYTLGHETSVLARETSVFDSETAGRARETSVFHSETAGGVSQARPRVSRSGGEAISLGGSVAAPPSKEQEILRAVIALELAQAAIGDSVRTIYEQMGGLGTTGSTMMSSEVAGMGSDAMSEHQEQQLVRPSGVGLQAFGGTGRRSSNASHLSGRDGQEKPHRASWTSHLQQNPRRSSIRFRDSKDSELPDEMNQAGDGAAQLPVNWPSVLSVRRIGKDSDISMGQYYQGISTAQRVGYMRNSSLGYMSNASSDSGAADFVGKKRRMRCTRCIREPDSRMAQVCNILGFMMLLFDLVVMPVVLAWSMPFQGALVVFAWISLSFWASEMILSFFTGFFEEGELIMDVHAASLHYLKTRFASDVTIVSCDFFSLLMMMVNGENSGGTTLRLARFAKLIRLMGLLRIVRAIRALEAMLERSLSEIQRTGLRIMVMVLYWLWMNHILACAWYAIGVYAHSDTGSRWVDLPFLLEQDVSYMDTGTLFQYATAIHWTIAQTTLGAMEVASVNTAERIFNVWCLLIGLFFGSSLISSLSAGMVEFRMSMRKRSHTMSTLRRYLLENNVNSKVALLVQRQAAARLNDTAMLTAKDVPALSTLATGMRHKLHSEICQPHLHNHQLFQLWYHIDKPWFQQFCSKAVELKFLRPEDDLFLPGGESAATYFVISGTMEYTQVPESSPVTLMTKKSVDHGAWLSEATLWCHWIHVGKMEATARCQVLTIHVEGFTMAMQEHYTIRAVATNYGRIFSERVVSSRPPQLTWPHDLNVPFTFFCDVVVSMPAEINQIVGSIALDHGRNHIMGVWKNSQAQLDLRQEVEDGKSIVILSLNGEIERVVALVALHLERPDGRVLVQLAKWEEARVKADVKLPGVKCKRSESSDEAIQRLLGKELEPLATSVEIVGAVCETTEQYSARFGVSTRYMRKVFNSRFTGLLHATDNDDAVMPVVTGGRSVKSARSGNPFVDRSSSHASASMDAFDNLPVYFVPRAEGGAFFAWLWDCDLQHLETFNKSQGVQRWLSSLSPDEASRMQITQVVNLIECSQV